MAKRKRIATYGRRGQLVRVNDEVHDGRRLVRVQWNETKGAPLQTESWPYSKANVESAKGFAQGTAQRLAAGAGAPIAERTIRELADLHIAAFVESWAPATLRNFRHRWARFEAFVGRTTSAKLITEETLDEFRTKMREAAIAVTQRGETVKAVKQVFRWAKRRKLIAENPIADYVIKLAKGERAAEVPEWSPDDVGRLGGQLLAERASRSSRHWRLEVAFFLVANQGPRSNAFLHLAWDDVNLSGETVRHPSIAGVVLPPRSVWWNPKYDKTAEERVQPLTRGAVRALRIASVWRARSAYDGPWILAPARASSRAKGEPWGYSAANRALGELAGRCTPAVEWVKGRAFHGFRKYSAGEIHRLTGSERAAADWIGDKDVRVVRKHYLKKRAEEQRGVAQRIDVDAAARIVAPSEPVAQVGTRPWLERAIKHGTRTGYNRGCRCEECTAAQRAHIRTSRGTAPEHFILDRPEPVESE
jgi:hypothetical protein